MPLTMYFILLYTGSFKILSFGMLFWAILAIRYLRMNFWDAIPCTRNMLEREHTGTRKPPMRQGLGGQRKVPGGGDSGIEL